MNSAVVIKTYDAPALCKTEILRYAGCKDADSNVISLLESCVNEAAGKFARRCAAFLVSVPTKYARG